MDSPKKAAPKRPVLRLLALDYAGLGHSMPGIERQISQMYARAGVEVRWRTAHYRKGKQGYELVGASPGGSPDATIRFMPDTAGLGKMTPDGMGATIAGSGLGNVIMSRVNNLAQGAIRPVNTDVMAALAGAHELGHALWSFDHTPGTIMRANFDPNDVDALRSAAPWNIKQAAAIQDLARRLDGWRLATDAAAAAKAVPVPTEPVRPAPAPAEQIPHVPAAVLQGLASAVPPGPPPGRLPNP